ncbi:hypothetical protein G6F43_003570 [Rhizopus delemar]|nr:hypothetical protein G6F43_003570 [Rhizopus delemar]
MSLQVYYQNEKDNIVDELNNVAVDMDADEEQMPLNITNFEECLDLKPPEREQKENMGRQADNLTPGKVGTGSNITRHTAYNWFKKDQKEIEDKPSDQAKIWQVSYLG